MTTTGRRARNRAARHQQLLEAAGEILSEVGMHHLTMQAVADRVDCAVGTIYTYFASKSALLAALQADALRVLSSSFDAAAGQWDEHLHAIDAPERAAALARLQGGAMLFVEWPEIQPREFDFLQVLLTTRGEVISTDDAAAVVPQALLLVSGVRVMIDAAVEVGALQVDPERPGDDSLARTVRWIGGLDGAVLVSTVLDSSVGEIMARVDRDAFDRHEIAVRLTHDLFRAWGATVEDVDAAAALVADMRARDVLFPEPI